MGTLHDDICKFLLSPKLFLEWEMLQARIVDKIKTHILCSINFFSKNHAVKYGRARKATDNNILCLRKYTICMPNN